MKKNRESLKSEYTSENKLTSVQQILFIFASVDLSIVKLRLLNRKLKIDEGEGNSHTKFSKISLI